jgi:CO dehydrogenase maturation factor
VREVVHSALAESKQITILDTEASLEHMKRGTSKYVDAIYIVVEPYYRSLEAGSRFQRLGRELDIKKIVAIANKVKNKEDEGAIIQFCEKIDLPVEIIIPYDETIAIADMGGELNMNEIVNSAALQKIEEIAEKIILQLN